MKVYIGIAYDLFGQLMHSERIYWECVWFVGTGRAL